jgi:hypothetical protein
MTALQVTATVTDGPFQGRRLVVRWTAPDLRGQSHCDVRVEIRGEMVPVSVAATVLAHIDRRTCPCFDGPRGVPCHIHEIGVAHTERTGTP